MRGKKRTVTTAKVQGEGSGSRLDQIVIDNDKSVKAALEARQQEISIPRTDEEKYELAHIERLLLLGRASPSKIYDEMNKESTEYIDVMKFLDAGDKVRDLVARVKKEQKDQQQPKGESACPESESASSSVPKTPN